jgi:hypothetical protein
VKLLGYGPRLQIGVAIAIATLAMAGCTTDSSTITTSSSTSSDTSAASGAPSPSTTAANTETTREFTVDAFAAVELAGPYELVVTVGNPTSIRAQGDPAALDLLDIRTDGGTLIAAVKPNVQWPTDAHVTVTATTPTITAADLNGSGRMRVGPVHTDTLTINDRGSGGIEAPELYVTKITVSVLGSGLIRAGGTADDADITLGGSGQEDLQALAVKRAKVSVAGSGNLSIQASEKVSGSLYGSGSIRVTGGATCSVSSAGSGTTTCS